MSIKTKIEWTDSSVNPIMGCTSCALREDHCYAAVLCARYAGRKGWPKSFDEPEFFPGRLEKAVRWKDLTGTDRLDKPWLNGLPQHIFVNDMSDGFCPDVDPWQWLAPSIPSMHLSPHIWLLLTKWPDRMRQFFNEWNKPIPSNFYLGTTVANADDLWRVGELLQISGAAVRFVSVEPMLGAVKFLYRQLSDSRPMADWSHPDASPTTLTGGIDWVICGPETGPGARGIAEFEPRARNLRDQCTEAGVPFFLKKNTNGTRQIDGREWNEMPGGAR